MGGCGADPQASTTTGPSARIIDRIRQAGARAILSKSDRMSTLRISEWRSAGLGVLSSRLGPSRDRRADWVLLLGSPPADDLSRSTIRAADG